VACGCSELQTLVSLVNGSNLVKGGRQKNDMRESYKKLKDWKYLDI
jgi:hypothetical protein